MAKDNKSNDNNQPIDISNIKEVKIFTNTLLSTYDNDDDKLYKKKDIKEYLEKFNFTNITRLENKPDKKLKSDLANILYRYQNLIKSNRNTYTDQELIRNYENHIYMIIRSYRITDYEMIINNTLDKVELNLDLNKYDKILKLTILLLVISILLTVFLVIAYLIIPYVDYSTGSIFQKIYTILSILASLPAILSIILFFIHTKFNKNKNQESKQNSNNNLRCYYEIDKTNFDAFYEFKDNISHFNKSELSILKELAERKINNLRIGIIINWIDKMLEVLIPFPGALVIIGLISSKPLEGINFLIVTVIFISWKLAIKKKILDVENTESWYLNRLIKYIDYRIMSN